MVRLHAFFSGRVQGVGFRYRTCRIAAGFPVTGYVRNLPDGRVELLAEGKRRDLESLLAAIQKEMEGLIRETAAGWEAAAGGLGPFDIAG